MSGTINASVVKSTGGKTGSKLKSAVSSSSQASAKAEKKATKLRVVQELNARAESARSVSKPTGVKKPRGKWVVPPSGATVHKSRSSSIGRKLIASSLKELCGDD